MAEREPSAVDFLGLREASAWLVEVFKAAEKAARQQNPKADPPAMAYEDLHGWLPSVAPQMAARLKSAPNPDRMLRQWAGRAVEDGVLERVDMGTRSAHYMLSPDGRRLALLPSL